MTYVDVRGHRTWHEVTGVGDPVALLHGAFAGASSFAAQTADLAGAGFRVHVPERRGHARTPDIEGPASYAIMAADTVDYLEQCVSMPAHLVGWSDGAVVAALVALHRPDLVRRLVLVGQYYNSTGRPADSTLLAMIGSPEAKGFLRTEYDQLSPDGPEHFDIVHAKSIQRIEHEPELTLAELAGLLAPTLVLQGDRDDVLLSHSAQLVDVLPDARLAVLPGTHLLPIELPEVVNPLIIRFLRAPFASDLFEGSAVRQNEATP